MRHQKERVCEREAERWGSNISALRALDVQSRPAKDLHRPQCYIHPKSIPLLAINFLIVNCNCTFLLPIIQVSLNAPFFYCIMFNHSDLDLLWVVPCVCCTGIMRRFALIQSLLMLRDRSDLSAIVHLNKYPFIVCSA